MHKHPNGNIRGDGFTAANDKELLNNGCGGLFCLDRTDHALSSIFPQENVVPMLSLYGVLHFKNEAKQAKTRKANKQYGVIHN